MTLTPEQHDELEGLIDSAESLYVIAYPPPETFYGDEYTPEARAHVEAAEMDIIAYVNGLLAAKNAEIAALKARQITPEIEKACRDLIMVRESDNHLMSRRGERDRECAIGVMMRDLIETWIERERDEE